MTNLKHVQIMHSTNKDKFIEFLCNACNDCDNCIMSTLCTKGHTGFIDYDIASINMEINAMAYFLCDLTTCKKCPVKSRCDNSNNGFKHWLQDEAGTEFCCENTDYHPITTNSIMSDIGISNRDFLM